ncbi:DUF4886 domain-containing protein [Niabella insulamsoli]|uniref:DUF4886 domain-containing protein n=1 Tax=Niabella insulamsoli TaxID=3144874 RepID=UPI0031FC595A
MKYFNRKLFRLCAGLFTVMALFVACKKDGNPNDLPTSVPESAYVGQTGAEVIKILAIGNSFSENAIESNLYELAKESGKTVIIGNMYIGGASLGQHAQNATANGSVYEYRKINTEGVKRNFPKVSIATALADEKWDYISFQQASPLSGLADPTQQDLTTVFNYVKSKVNNPEVKYIYHQTWAYAPNTSNTGFANYDNDQTTMYNGIVSVSQNVKNIVPVDIIVPAGTAIQDARTSLLGESFTVGDGYHLNELGKYTAACTWFEALFGTSVVGAKYKPAGISNFEVSVAQNAAHFAVLKSFEITSMADFQVEPAPLQYPVLIDFGNAAPSPSWNQVSSYTEGTKANLKDSVNAFVGISLVITERFNAINTNGATGTTTSLNMPDNVSARNFYGNSRGPLFNGITTPQSVFELSGLVKNITYNFCFFGSRAASDNRETLYTVAGENSGSASLNAGSNATEVACVSNIKPDANGKIKVTVTSGPNNVTSNGWFYINAAKITSNN